MRTLGILLTFAAWVMAQVPLAFCVTQAEDHAPLHVCAHAHSHDDGHRHDHGHDDGLTHGHEASDSGQPHAHIRPVDPAPAPAPIVFAEPRASNIAVRPAGPDSARAGDGDVLPPAAAGLRTIVLLL